MRYIVTAMPQRIPYVKEMKKQIPDLEIVWDRHRNAMETFVRSLEHAGEDAIVHLEDDIQLTSNFVEKIEGAIKERPDELIKFFSRYGKDLTEGSRYLAGATWMMNQCFYLPAKMALRLVGYYKSGDWDEQEKIHPTGLEQLMADYFKIHKLRYWNYVPSLVQHREAISLIDKRRSSRRSSNTFVE